MTELKANRHYKDRVFRMIFNSREKLLELYNAMNGTDYEKLFLYEQQSSKMEICLCVVSFMSVTAIPGW